MELNIDLVKLNIDLVKRQSKPRLRVILGIIIFLCGTGLIIYGIKGEGFIIMVNRIYSFLLALGGIMLAIEGLGYPVEKLFGKAYIIINSDLISLKSSVFEKEQSVNWNDIKSIDYKLNRYIIQKVDNKTLIIDLTKFEYFLNKEIKKTIDYIAQEKNI